MHPQKSSIIPDWARPTFLYYVRSFFRFYNFYWHFIQNFSKLAKFHIGLIKKDAFFDWILAYQSAFEYLKKIITETPMLTYYKQGHKTFVEIDSSNYVYSWLLFQLGKNRLLHLIIFFSKNLNLIECNYENYNEKILAIIWLLHRKC